VVGKLYEEQWKGSLINPHPYTREPLWTGTRSGTSRSKVCAVGVHVCVCLRVGLEWSGQRSVNNVNKPTPHRTALVCVHY